MSTVLRAIRLLAIVVWVGGIAFFAFVLAPVAFHVLPTHEAGLVVGGTLPVLDKIGFVCGLLFLLTSNRLRLSVRGGLAQWIFVVLMLVLTISIHGSILPRMERDRASVGGNITLAAPLNPARVHFDRLHAVSEKLEGVVLLAGLAVVCLLAAETAPPPPVTAPGSNFWLSLTLGLGAGLADCLGGLLLVRRSPSARALRYFVALGSGFMLAAAMLEMVPEGLRVNPRWAPALILLGYCGVHLLEHTLVPHFHFGEETHHHEFLSAKTSYSVLLGLAAHTFFDGIAIGSGFVLSSWLGWVIFLAVFLHKIPEGFTIASVMLAAGRSRRTALNAALLLGTTTVMGVLVISLVPRLVWAGLPLSAGVTIYVAATDLVPEVNREPGIRMALVFFGGVAVFFLLRLLGPV